jgi:YD repeat-containing protein
VSGRSAWIALLALLGDAQAALSQPSPTAMVPPRRVADARGVDLVSGSAPIDIPLVSFGEHATALAASFEYRASAPLGAAVTNDFLQVAGAVMGGMIRPQAFMTGADGSPDEFGAYENYVFPTGAGFAQQLLQYPRGNPGGGLSVHTNPDGSRYGQSFGTSHFTRFESSDPSLVGVYDAAGDRGIINAAQPHLYQFEKIILANGEEWRFYRQYLTIPCAQSGTMVCQSPTETIYRLRFLTSSRGYGIQFLYQSDATPASNRVAGLWWAPRRVTAYNKAITYCNESLLQECTPVSALPSAEIAYNASARTATVRQPAAADGVELTFLQTNGLWGGIASMRHTAVPNSTVSYQYATDSVGVGYVSRVTDADGQWNYTHITYVDDSGRTPYMAASSTNPAGGAVGIFGYGIFGTIQTFTDELGRTYNYSDGFPFRDNGRSEPEGDETAIRRDERNNITAIVHYPKPNPGLPSVTLYSATFPEHCTNPRTCNRPTTATDANNNVRTYSYAAEHGGVLTETGPSVPTRQADGSIANVQPQKRYEYAQRFAWIANGAGGYMQGPSAIWLLTRERRCIATAAAGSGCAGGPADEVVTDYDYGPDSGPNNLLLRGIAVTAYVDGATVVRRTCYGYDAAGNRIGETQPNANLASCP